MNISQTNKSLRPNDIFSIDDKMYMSLVGCDKFACINKKTDEIEFLKDNANGIHAYSYVSIFKTSPALITSLFGIEVPSA